MRRSAHRFVIILVTLALISVFATASATATVVYRSEWGGTAASANDDGLFNNPSAIALSPDGNTIYVADAFNRIQRFGPDGADVDDDPDFINKWGQSGPAPNQFAGITDMTVDAAGNVYVTDFNNNRVAKYTSTGSFVFTWGTAGSGDGELANPTAVAADAAGNFYVAEYGNNRVSKFTPDGPDGDPVPDFALTWGTAGAGNGQFAQPRGIAVDPAGASVYVSEEGNDRIQKFGPTGNFILKWGTNGVNDGQLADPHHLEVDGAGLVYVVEFGNNRVQKFSSGGVAMMKFGSMGTGQLQFQSPFSIAIDPAGYVYVTDTGANDRVQKFSESGSLTSLPPVRILDTRFGMGVPGGSTAPIAPGAILDLDVTNTFSSGVPAAGVDAVVMNVTATGPTANGWLTMFPKTTPVTPPPSTSSFNFNAGSTTGSLVVVKIGHGGAAEGIVSIANSFGNPAAGTVHVIADIVGWYSDGTTTPAARFTGLLNPSRILDTRFNQGLTGAFAPNQTRDLLVGGMNGVPADADSVVMNVTVTGPTANGWLVLFPTGSPLPNTSSLNFVAGQTVPNLVTIKIAHGGGGIEGKVSISNTGFPTGPPPPAGTVHVIADVLGYYKNGTNGASLNSMPPQRILDTRFGTGVPGGSTAPVPPQGSILVIPKIASGLPLVGAYSGVVVNVAVTGPTAQGWLTAFPTGQMLPNAANVNFLAGQTVANLVKIRVGTDGRFMINNTGGCACAGSAHVVVDIVGWYQ